MKPVLIPKNQRKKLVKKMLAILSVMALLLLFAAYTVNRQGATWPEEIVQVVIAPVQGAFQRLTRSVEGILATVKSYQELRAENAELRARLGEAITLEARLTELRKENERLRRMLALRETSEYELIAAEVIARDPNNWFSLVTINKGSRHGVRQRMAVITTDGLIGSVFSVSPTTAQVQLLTDPRRSVSAIIQRSRETGAVGTVESDPQSPGYLRMMQLPRDANVLPGDSVISSGLGGVFPKGLLIGFVLSVAEDEQGLTINATLQPAATFNRLEEVFVVIPGAATEPETGDVQEEPLQETELQEGDVF
ncbi:MAG TPA: rod shape-determining protein MreC [Firmicutes bacterium]|nr:rod shape-determining protein MreC [Bacillota bacterium]